MAETFAEVLEVRELTREMVDSLLRGLEIGALIMDSPIDLERGQGVLGGNRRCCWLENGKRLSVNVASGTIVADVSNEPDPSRPEPRSWETEGRESHAQGS